MCPQPFLWYYCKQIARGTGGSEGCLQPSSRSTVSGGLIYFLSVLTSKKRCKKHPSSFHPRLCSQHLGGRASQLLFFFSGVSIERCISDHRFSTVSSRVLQGLGSCSCLCSSSERHDFLSAEPRDAFHSPTDGSP